MTTPDSTPHDRTPSADGTSTNGTAPASGVHVHDVAIVGCGVHGAAAAFHLAERGVDVAVIERGTPASGPTGRSSAVLRGYYVNQFLGDATRESVETFRNFTEITHGGQASFVPCGALFMHGPQDLAKVRATVEDLSNRGSKIEVLTRDQLADAFGEFDLDGIDHGVWEEVAGHADPAGTTFGFVNRAIELGGTLHRYSEVVDIVREAGGTQRVEIAGAAPVRARQVLLAAGPWSTRLLGIVGVTDVPLWAERHLIATYGWGTIDPFPFVWASIPDGIYVKPERHAQYLVGTLLEEPRVDPDDFDAELAPDEQLRITESLLTRAPYLEESELRTGYSALYDVAPDWQPVVGEVAEDVFIVAGTAGHGFKWAPAMGRHLADLMTGAPTDPRLQSFSHDRFRSGSHLDAGFGAAKIIG